MEAGKLHKRFTIEKPTLSEPDDFMAQTTVWSTFLSTWGKISPLSGREFEYAKSFSATVSHKITTRFLPGVLTTYRVNYGGRFLNINAALNTDEQGRELTLYCTEIQPV